MTADFDSSAIPDPTLEEGWEQDSTSEREALYWPNYDEVSKQKTANTLKIHRAIGWCIPVAIILAFGAFILLSGIYILHIVGPHSFRWLDAPEIGQLHTMLFSGIVGAAATQAARVYLSGKE